MKKLNQFIKEAMEDWWKTSDFDDREVNYYFLTWEDKYESLAGPMTQEYRSYFIIWDKEELSEEELNKTISKHTTFEKKETNKANDDFREVKHGTLKDIMEDARKDSKNHYWVDIVDTKKDVTVYWIDA